MHLYCLQTTNQVLMRIWDHTVTPVLRGHSKRRQKLVFKNDYHLMQVKSIAECSIFIKLPFAIWTFVLSIFEWPLKDRFYCSCFFMHLKLLPGPKEAV